MTPFVCSNTVFHGGGRPIMAINCVKKPLFYHDESSGRMYLTLKLTLQNLQKIDDSCLKPPPT